MKLIPCGDCRSRYVTFPDGLPYTLARMTTGPITGTCAKCKRRFRITVEEFNRLPDLSLDDLRDLGKESGNPGLADHLALNDLRGQGMTDEHLAVMEGLGVDVVS